MPTISRTYSPLTCVPYLSSAPRWRCVKLPRTRWSWVSPGCGTSSSSLRASTFQPHRWAGRCSSWFSPPFVLAALCTADIWEGGIPRRTSCRTCGRRTRSPARTSERGKAGTPAFPLWKGDVTSTVFRGKNCCFVRQSAADKRFWVLLLHGPLNYIPAADDPLIIVSHICLKRTAFRRAANLSRHMLTSQIFFSF